MIPTKNTDIVVSGNLNGDKIAMGVHASSLQKLIGILTDLYSDPELAVIREYSTNAIDSHIAAGVSRPIEVSLPSPLSPFLRIRDFGLGMSVNDVREVYSQYGASTKDTSNDFNGMLGLGSKSALTYTAQFTVIAIKGGIKATVAVSRAADGTGTMEVVDTVSTTEPNGVEIVVPVKYGSSFESKARDFYKFWKPGTVLVNGKEPSVIQGNEVAPNIYSVRGLRGDFIVQGNVAYPVANEGLYKGGYYKDFGVVAYVPNGSVTFAPSREALMYDAVTNAEVQRIRDAFSAGLLASIQKDIDSSAHALEALKRWHNWKQMFGYNMPTGIKFKGNALGEPFGGYFMVFEPDAYRNQTQGRRNLGYNEITGDAVIVTDWHGDRPNQTQKQKLKIWADENGVDVDRFIMVPKMFGAPFTDNVETVSWDDVAKVKINKNATPKSGVRGKVSWKVYNGSYFVDNDDPKPTSAVLYLSPQDKIDDSLLDALLAFDANLTIVKLGRNRWDKFLRQFPKAQHVNVYAKAAAKTYKDFLTDDDKVQISMGSSLRRTLKAFDASKIHDPEVVEAITLANGSVSSAGIKHYTQMRNIARWVGEYTPEVTVEVKNPLDRYPLINTDGYYGIKVTDHHYLYMNAAYAAEK